MVIAKRIQVYGRVQGVGFRWFTCQEARQLGVIGWVMNRPDGSVLIHAQGSEDAVQSLQTWAERGPTHAQVTGLEAMLCPLEDLSGFTTRGNG